MKLVKRASWPSDPFYEMDRLFNRAFGGREFWPEAFFSAADRDFPLDVYGDDERYYVVAELPGVSKKSIDLKVENSVLSISVKREEREGNNDSVQMMSRSITVGDDIDVDRVTAKLEDGLLTVVLPKAEESKPKKISIK